MSIDAPLALHTETILPDWIDYNGHMNVAYYVLVFDHATDVFLDYIGLTDEFRNVNESSTFAAELHVSYQKEVREDDEVVVTTQLLGFDEKRIHYFHQMYNKKDMQLSATIELISLYMDMRKRKVGVMPPPIRDNLASILASHESLPLPQQVGSRIGLKKKKTA